VYFLKLYLATHISQTQDSFNSVVVIVVNVRTCCRVFIHHKLIQFISSMSSSSYDKGRILQFNLIYLFMSRHEVNSMTTHSAERRLIKIDNT